MSDLDDFFSDACAPKVVRRKCSTALSPSNLPGLDFALNPYTRCGHGCTYCYAPYVMRTSPLDWTKDIVAKVNIPEVLARELPRRKGAIGLGTVTDPYQPLERELQLTRQCLEVMAKYPTDVSVLTKSDLVVRDIDLLSLISKMEVGITINTSSDEAARIFEPCAPPPSVRMKAVKTLSSAGISTYVFLGPVIPSITDEDPTGLIKMIAEAGAEHVMMDRLNLRPGMMGRMDERLSSRSPIRSSFFRTKAASSDYYEDKLRDIKRACDRESIECRDAF